MKKNEWYGLTVSETFQKLRDKRLQDPKRTAPYRIQPGELSVRLRADGEGFSVYPIRRKLLTDS